MMILFGWLTVLVRFWFWIVDRCLPLKLVSSLWGVFMVNSFFLMMLLVLSSSGSGLGCLAWLLVFFFAFEACFKFLSLMMFLSFLLETCVVFSFLLPSPYYIDPASVISIFKWWETKKFEYFSILSLWLFCCSFVFFHFLCNLWQTVGRAARLCILVNSNNLGDFFPLFSLNDNKKANCSFAFFSNSERFAWKVMILCFLNKFFCLT